MNKPKPDLAIMYSGGLDSFISAHYAKSTGYKNPVGIYVDLGHEYAQKERDAILKTNPGIPIKFLNMSDLWPLLSPIMTNQIIPSRNLLLATIGSMVAPVVWINSLKGEEIMPSIKDRDPSGTKHDKSVAFFEKATDILTMTNFFFRDNTTIESPFKDMTKADSIRWALDAGVDIQELYSTTSCYSGDDEKCGHCLTCYKRFSAFLLNEKIEPGYSHNPLRSEYARNIDKVFADYVSGITPTIPYSNVRVQEWMKLQSIKQDFNLG